MLFKLLFPFQQKSLLPVPVHLLRVTFHVVLFWVSADEHIGSASTQIQLVSPSAAAISACCPFRNFLLLKITFIFFLDIDVCGRTSFTERQH